MRNTTGAAARSAQSDATGFACEALHGALGADGKAAAYRCAADIAASLDRTGKELGDCGVLVMFGGGKDSAYATGFVRAVQLTTQDMIGATFRLRVATYRHRGITRPVMRNIARTYERLALHEGPLVETVLVDGDDVVPFNVERPVPETVRRSNRNSLLMAGHRSAGDGRASFCDSCNLGMARSFQLAASSGAGVDLIVTGDSRTEQLRYAAWTKMAAIRFGVEREGRHSTTLASTLTRLADLHGAYVADVQGVNAKPSPVAPNSGAPPEFFSIYPYTNYELGAHRSFVEDYLGFQFDPLAWAYTESDCANPLIMSLMRGLTFERLRGRPFAEGVQEYAAFALDLMRKKAFPEDLIASMGRRFAGASGAAALRRTARQLLRCNYALEEGHLVAALFSPFTDNGARLESWARAEAPALLDNLDEIRMFASGRAPGRKTLLGRIERLTALEPDQMRHLWNSPLTANLAGAAAPLAPLAFVRRHDPHKATILSPQADGSVRPEVVTGR